MSKFECLLSWLYYGGCCLTSLVVRLLFNFDNDRGYEQFSAVSVAGGLKWVRAKVPHYRFPGGTAQLQCNYDLGNDTLYTVKWYKENEEFYRFVPKAMPQANSYDLEGVHVNVSLKK